MASENSVKKIEKSSLDSNSSESATGVAEQSMVLRMAEVPSNQPGIASASRNMTFYVDETEGKDLISKLEYQNPNVKNTDSQSSDDLPKGYAPLLESLGGGMKVSDEPRVIRRSFFSSAGYHVEIISHGIETEHFYPWDSETGRYKRCQCASHSSKSNSSMNRSGISVCHNSGLRSYRAPSSFRKSSLHSQNITQLNKECHSTMTFSSPRNNHQFGNASNGPTNDYGYTSLQSYKDNKATGVSKEIVCGPRALGLRDSGKTNELDDENELPYFARRRHFNLPDFQTDYQNAKFYIIKSFGEDNVHKSIKYGVWSSTPYGNGKLETAYHEAKAKSIETGTKCPIFFFFSVNKSGQFVGVAEMIGRVDFSKDLDFWQLDKWSGFFPVKWHILKDIPHNELRHIILKENDNRAVTYTRDTQEIGLCQGTEMLKIFKNYSAKTSLLDDFSFYENREKLRVAERKIKAEKQKSEKYRLENYRVQEEDAAGYGGTYYYNHSHEDIASVVSRTRNLSLNSRSP